MTRIDTKNELFGHNFRAYLLLAIQDRLILLTSLRLFLDEDISFLFKIFIITDFNKSEQKKKKKNTFELNFEFAIHV